MGSPGPYQGASPARAVVLAVRFLLELALLAAVAACVLALVQDWWRWPAALLAAALVAGIWGLFVSPKAVFRLGWPVVLLIEAFLFLDASFGLYLVGYPVAGIMLAAAWVLHRVALSVFRR